MLMSTAGRARATFALAITLAMAARSAAHAQGRGSARETTFTCQGGGAMVGYDRLVLAAGSVNKLLPVPGICDWAHGFRGIPEALYLRDHMTRQVELADATDDQRHECHKEQRAGHRFCRQPEGGGHVGHVAHHEIVGLPAFDVMPFVQQVRDLAHRQRPAMKRQRYSS